MTKVGAIIGSTAIITTLALSGTAFAQTATAPNATAQGRGGFGGGMHRAPGVFGTVASISGNTITVTSKGFGSNATATTYTVNATNATVTKSGAASTVAGIAIGDSVMVQGTVSGTSVTATAIRDGVTGGRMGGTGMRGFASSTTPDGKKPNAALANITGNGQPVIGGTVASISGTTLSITNKSNVSFSVDASNATVNKGGATSTVASIATGDSVIVQGTVNGSSVVASSVIDQGVVSTASTSATPSTSGAHGGFLGGLFGGIGGFFQHLFGF